MRTFDIHAVLMHEDFEGYRDLAALLDVWTAVDAAGIGTLSLETDPYSVGGQRKHPRFTVDNTSGALGSVRLQSIITNNYGYWMPFNASVLVDTQIYARYRCSPGLAGSTFTAFLSNSAFPGDASATVIADAQWHEINGNWPLLADSFLGQGLRLTLSDIPSGASGTIDFDDFRLVRQGNLERGIDWTAPVASMRCDWADGVRETYTFPTRLMTAKDGSETRTSLRVVPRMRLEYTTLAGDPVEAARTDAWLWANQGRRVSVPRWQDALRFGGLIESGTWIWLDGGTTTDRWFQPQQRALLWRAPDDFEAVIVWQVGSNFMRLDSNVNVVQGSWDAVTLVVPLIPGRLIGDLDVRRPNGRLGTVPLAFELDTAN